MTTTVHIIIGPTASGKSALAETIAQHENGEIINADVAQCYVPLTIGTAKPDWRHQPFKSHLFDIFDEPVTYNAVAYRKDVIAAVHACVGSPIVVGGSLFYVKSLFFPPVDLPTIAATLQPPIDYTLATEDLWRLLDKIDPERAHVLHVNDRYRIQRALKIWQQTGQKPSSLQPKLLAPFPTISLIALDPPRDALYAAINKRTQALIDVGWVDEAEALLDTPWEPFVVERGFIGYAELFAWIRSGKKEPLLSVTEIIAQKTRNYARRQGIFMRSFLAELEQHKHSMNCMLEIQRRT